MTCLITSKWPKDKKAYLHFTLFTHILGASSGVTAIRMLLKAHWRVISQTPKGLCPWATIGYHLLQKSHQYILDQIARKEEKQRKERRKPKNTGSDSDDGDSPAAFLGDQSLAQSCRFLYDATISREIIYATAEGDVGRVWEAMKVCLNL